MKVYSEYRKESDRWFPSAPAHWIDVPVWTMFTRDARKGHAGERLLSVYRDHGVVPKDSRDDNNNRPSDDLSTYQLVEPGDLVVNKMKAWQGSLSISRYRGIVSPAYFVYRPHHNCDDQFLHYLLRSKPLIGAYVGMSKGVRISQWDLEPYNFSRLKLALPPIAEQRAIVKYLDQQTARIDTLIAEQQQLIDLLGERRRAIRTEGAIRGTRDIETIPSPLPWASKLPDGWQVVPLTSVARLESGHTPSRTREDWWQDCYIPWISLNDVGQMRKNKYIGSTTHQLSDEGIANSSARLLPKNTVVLSRDATVGRTAIMRIPMATSQHFAAWVCGPRLYPEYLWTLFTDAMQPYFASFKNGSTIRTIGMGDLKAFRIPLPPLEEQHRIVAVLDRQTSKIDALIVEAERFIELSVERRSALITAAVTGQIDVHGEAG